MPIESNNKNNSPIYRICSTDEQSTHADIESQQAKRVLLSQVAVKTSSTATATATKAIQVQGHGLAPLQRIFVDDLTERRHLRRVPWFILFVSLLQTALHLLAQGCSCIQQRLIFMPAFKHEYWRYLTYMLLHSDLLHLLLNLCLQCLVGCCLELEQGHCRLAFIYMAGGIFGSLATAWLQPQLSLLGASAGVYALLTSHIPHLAKNFTKLSHRYLRIIALLILSFSDIGFTTFHIIVKHNANPRICLVGHIAGGLAGLLFGSIIYSSGRGQCTDCF